MSTCGHSPYWVGNYGTCMVCRAEKAEDEVAALKAANAEVEATFNDLRRSAQVAREERDAARARAGRMESALQLIATPVRADGTYNRCREACEQIAREALATPANGGEANG